MSEQLRELLAEEISEWFARFPESDMRLTDNILELAERLCRKVDPPALVLRDAEDDTWVYLGNGEYAITNEVARGVKYTEMWKQTREEIEFLYGPVVMEYPRGEAG